MSDTTRKAGLPSAYQPAPIAICPGCYRGGVLVETVPPRGQHLGYYQCCKCSWTGPGTALQAKPDDQAEEGVAKQVRDCLAEDRRRGQKGGGSRSGKSYGKEDKLKPARRVSLDDSFELIESRKLEPATEHLSVRNLPSEVTSEDILAAIQKKILRQGY